MMFLTPEEIVELTDYQRHADQRRWLTNHGWQFEVSRTGRPVVGRDYAKQRTGLAFDSTGVPKRKAWQPNIAAIRDRA